MSKSNLKLYLGVVLGLNIFLYLGLRSIQWIWMSNNNYVNEYLPYLGIESFSFSNIIFIFLPNVLPVILLIVALVLSKEAKLSLIFVSLAFFSRILGLVMAIFFYFSDYDWGIIRSVQFTLKRGFLGLPNFTLFLDLFSMVVTLASTFSMIFIAILLMKRVSAEKLNTVIN